MKMARNVGSTLIEKGAEIWLDPAKAVALAEQGGALTAEIAKLALMGEDSPTRFKGEPGVGKRVAWAEPAAARRGEGRSARRWAPRSTTCCSPASRARFANTSCDKGDPTDGVMIRALVPVNLRPPGEGLPARQPVRLVFLDLPIGIENPVERLYAVRANMRALKGSLQPILDAGPARRDGRGTEAAAGAAAARCWRATRPR